jgi:hypothetical protein
MCGENNDIGTGVLQTTLKFEFEEFVAEFAEEVAFTIGVETFVGVIALEGLGELGEVLETGDFGAEGVAYGTHLGKAV